MHDDFVFVKRGVSTKYRKPLIAIDLDNVDAVRSCLELFDSDATVIVLTAYRIPYAGSRVLFGANRLMGALAATARETLDALIGSVGLQQHQCELLVRHGNLQDHVINEIRSRDLDLTVLAFRNERLLERPGSHRLVQRILQLGTCDLLVARDSQSDRLWWSEETLVTPGPW